MASAASARPSSGGNGARRIQSNNADSASNAWPARTIKIARFSRAKSARGWRG